MGSPTSLLNTVTLSEFTDLVEKQFVQTQQLVKPNAQQLFIYEDMADHTGNTRRYDEVDTETYASLKREGMDAAKTLVGVGYNKIMTAKRIAKEIDITWEMRRYNKYPEVTAKLTSLSSFCPQRTEIDLTHVFTFATSSSYVDMDGDTVDVSTGDGQSLINAAHTLKFSATTYSNRVSGDPAFSKSGLEAAEALTNTNILSNFGERRVMKFNKIITGDDPNTVNNVSELLRSTAAVAAPNSGVTNVYENKYQHVVLPYLATTATGVVDSTKKRWWFLGATGQSVMGWQAYFGQWEAPHLQLPAEGRNSEDAHNDNWTYGTRSAYGIVTLAGRGMIGSHPVS